MKLSLDWLNRGNRAELKTAENLLRRKYLSAEGERRTIEQHKNVNVLFSDLTTLSNWSGPRASRTVHTDGIAYNVYEGTIYYFIADLLDRLMTTNRASLRINPTGNHPVIGGFYTFNGLNTAKLQLLLAPKNPDDPAILSLSTLYIGWASQGSNNLGWYVCGVTTAGCADDFTDEPQYICNMMNLHPEISFSNSSPPAEEKKKDEPKKSRADALYEKVSKDILGLAFDISTAIETTHTDNNHSGPKNFAVSVLRKVREVRLRLDLSRDYEEPVTGVFVEPPKVIPAAATFYNNRTYAFDLCDAENRTLRRVVFGMKENGNLDIICSALTRPTTFVPLSHYSGWSVTSVLRWLVGNYVDLSWENKTGRPERTTDFPPQSMFGSGDYQKITNSPDNLEKRSATPGQSSLTEAKLVEKLVSDPYDFINPNEPYCFKQIGELVQKVFGATPFVGSEYTDVTAYGLPQKGIYMHANYREGGGYAIPYVGAFMHFTDYQVLSYANSHSLLRALLVRMDAKEIHFGRYKEPLAYNVLGITPIGHKTSDHEQYGFTDKFYSLHVYPNDIDPTNPKNSRVYRILRLRRDTHFGWRFHNVYRGPTLDKCPKGLNGWELADILNNEVGCALLGFTR